MLQADKDPSGPPHWRAGTFFTHFRHRLAHTDALPQLALLGIVSGLLTGLVAVAFRLAIEWPLEFFLPAHNSEGFESLPLEVRLLLPLAGTLLIALVMRARSQAERQCGVGHVIERYQQHQAHLPARNAIVQFIAGSLAALSGHSVGREGPAVHLGATCSSLLGQKLGLPNNSLRIMVGCGVAAAIAASFNTPLAGVIFAMEVVLMEYTVTGFIPIILASVSGALVSRVCFGDAPAFAIPALTMGSMLELPFLIFCGIIVGLASSAVLKLHQYIQGLKTLPLSTRLFAAGTLTSLAAAFVPQVMGVGYDTVEAAMLGELSLTLLLTIAATKLLLSTATIALGVPGGSIGPTLVIGACLGGAIGIVGASLSPVDSASSGFYATIGMGAMMAGVLNAPLAALMALLELTYNSAILLPAMLVIVIATITARLTSRLPGLFLIGRNPEHFTSPVFQSLSRAGVTSLMSRNFIAHDPLLPFEQAEALLNQHPEWIVIEDDSDERFILRPSDLAHHLQTMAASDGKHEAIDLLGIPGERWRLHPIHPRSTLQEALMLIREQNGFAVHVTQPTTATHSPVAGIITRDQIDNYYQ
ncbi:MAG: chloride channel protein [Gammaproteobacteria bacterium]|nr:chloride channel protein [Gammaproteobacteria bacterium]MBQ0840949.1 chloride channel protein [Gammaproteobacteria bacterium]